MKKFENHSRRKSYKQLYYETTAVHDIPPSTLRGIINVVVSRVAYRPLLFFLIIVKWLRVN